MSLSRQKLLDAYFLMVSCQMAFFKIAINICLLDELKELDGFLDEEDEFHRDILDTMKDPIVIRIGQFIKETDQYLDQLDENNNFLDEELDPYGEPLIPDCEEKLDREGQLGLLALYFEDRVSRLKDYIGELCVINNQIPITNYENTELCDDEDIKSIAGFYAKGLQFVNYLIDNKFEV